MAKQEKVRASKSMTKEELAGEIYDINKKNGYKNPFSRKKAINIMVNGLETEKGYSKAELAEMRDSLLGIKPKKQTPVAVVKPKAEKATQPSVKPSKSLTPFQENMTKTAEACNKLEAAGYELQGSSSGIVTVLKVAKTRTLPSGNIVKEFEPVYRGKSYITAAEKLLKEPAKSKSRTMVGKSKKK